jgi:major membrane immunogen (membrane-anchored lipoprotein)
VKLHSSKSVLFTIAAILLTFGLAACGGSDGNGDGNGNNNGGLTEADFEDWCTEAKSCLGDQTFQMTYGSIDDCASAQFTTFEGAENQCGAAAQNYYKCFIQNFDCVQGTPQPDQTACQEEATEFAMQCSTTQ